PRPPCPPPSPYTPLFRSTPYLRDFLLDRGALGDVSETAAPWSRLGELYTATVRAARAAYAELGVQGFIMCHLSHSYHSGACLYLDRKSTRLNSSHVSISY